MSPPSLRYGATSETGLRGIQPAELDQFWPVAAPLLERGLKHGAGYRWTLPALRRSIAENRHYLWLTWPGAECAVITGIEDYPAAKLLQILWVCGRLPENWRAIVASLERWGASGAARKSRPAGASAGRASWRKRAMRPCLGSLCGRSFEMPSGGGNTTTTTQASGPPAWLQPFLKQGADQDWSLYNTPGPGYYPGTTVANPSTATQAGNQAAVARGLNGNAAENAGTGYLTNVLNGKYLGGQNLDPVHRSIAASVIPNVNAQFSLGGRYGSPDHAGSMTTALANAEAPYDYGNYQTERANQQSAAGMAPSYASQDWQDIAGLQSAGATAGPARPEPGRRQPATLGLQPEPRPEQAAAIHAAADGAELGQHDQRHDDDAGQQRRDPGPARRAAGRLVSYLTGG